MEKRTYYNEGNPNNITRAALFIFFMRTCYNGIYSVNHSGKLSVTFGAGGRVKLLEEELIRFNHKLLQDVVILDGDYRQTAEYTGANSLFYFDPPYKPVNEGNSCTSYMPQDFGDEEQINLVNVILLVFILLYTNKIAVIAPCKRNRIETKSVF